MDASPEAPIKKFLELNYEELEELNIAARAIKDPSQATTKHVKYLESEKTIKAMTASLKPAGTLLKRS